MSSLNNAAESLPVTESKGKKTSTLVLEIAQTILLTLIIFLSVRMIVQNFRVEGGSMEPTFQPGQYILINKVTYFRLENLPFVASSGGGAGGNEFVFGEPQRGDVIVFHAPTYGNKPFIKRVVGIPGDEVRIVRGQVYVNGMELEEPYVQHQATYSYPLNGASITIPPGHYFVLGDNRPHSADSHLGWTVSIRDIVGKAWISYWPPSEWGVIRDMAYAGLD